MRDGSFADLIAPYERVALVLQGGGALGAYQAGVVEGLFKHEIHPTWVAGVSIGAINAALIAGNPPERRCAALSEFWTRVAPPSPWEGAESLWRRLDPDGPSISVLSQWSAWRTALSGQPGFFRPRPAVEWAVAGPFAGPTSLYDTAPLKSTLEDLIDFDRVNAGGIRLSLGAVNVRTGNSIYFDTDTHRIGPEHVMASGALPPGFAPVEIDGEFYWDGGLVSNTPLDHVLEDRPRRDTLVFQVDLWSASGQVPRGMSEVLERQKDIIYSSRTRFNTDKVTYEQTLRNQLVALLDRLPDDLRHTPEARALRTASCDAAINIIHLIYRRKSYERDSKDYEFSNAGMREHWDSGLADTLATLAHPEWLVVPPRMGGPVTHDVLRDQAQPS
ncbi:patatin-like phospholipase family protein [Azospirillum sp. HJ39]|uniref:patatin-like phospholipase family protein n=1 Tax=Azospirillum sp. HJ39 TaxID=3159496 RepID=UPI0035577779